MRLVAITLLAACAMVACAPTARRPALEDADTLTPIAGIPQARYWADATPPDIEDRIAKVVRQRRSAGLTGMTALAMSGGADNGAFGAGVMNAWTERGDRPEFATVTGVSTGALVAPFVFLGPKYDAEMKRLYGGIPTDEIIRLRSVFRVLPSGSVVDTTPMAEIISGYITEGFLAEIAAQHARGRRLFVQTTNMDAQRPVLWDMGAIASSGAPQAEALFEDVLLASASVPVAFPPVFFEFRTADGERFSEMHADGGVASQITVAEGWQGRIHELSGSGNSATRLVALYVLFNGRIDPEPQSVDFTIPEVASRALDTMTKEQRERDLANAYSAARKRDAAFRMAAIEPDFELAYSGPFDVDYMTRLYNYGYEKTLRGEIWQSAPPQ